MSFNFIITFAVCIGVYLLIVLTIGIIKKIKKKKHQDKQNIDDVSPKD